MNATMKVPENVIDVKPYKIEARGGAPVNRIYQSPLPAPLSIRDIQRDTGKRLRELRMMRGLSQEQLGERVHVSMQQIQKYETAAANISVARLVHLAQALGVTPAEFFAAEDDTK